LRLVGVVIQAAAEFVGDFFGDDILTSFKDSTPVPKMWTLKTAVLRLQSCRDCSLGATAVFERLQSWSDCSL
jgi:hypothetical protein